MEDNLKRNQDNFCKWLGSDPDHIISECGDILSFNQFKDLKKLPTATEKIRRLLEIILAGGENTCQKFCDILEKEQSHYKDLREFFHQGGPAESCGPSMLAAGNSVITAQKHVGLKAKSLSYVVQTCSGPRGGYQPGTGKTPMADYMSCDNSVICADTFKDAEIDGPVNISVIQTSPAPSAKPQSGENTCYPEGSAVETIRKHKVDLINWLSADPSFILQHVHAESIVTDRCYRKLINIQDKEDQVIALIDELTGKGEGPCLNFLQLLKEEEILKTYPQLQKRISFFVTAQPSMSPSAPHEDKLPFFKRNRCKLVQKVKNVDPILDELLSGSYHPEMASTVHAQDTPQKKMRKVLESTTTARAADALFKALLQHEPDVMRELS